MRLPGVFCLKTREICILISWPLAPNSKIIKSWILKLVAQFLLLDEVQFVFLHSVIFEEALGKFLLVLLYRFWNLFNRVFWILIFFTELFTIKKFYLIVVLEEGSKTLEFLPGTCAQIFVDRGFVT